MEIQNSYATLDGLQGAITVMTGASIMMPITDDSVYPTISGSEAAGYSLYIQVGFPNVNRTFYLNRSERREVRSDTTELVFEWTTAHVALRVQDQNGMEIQGSYITFDGNTGPVSFSTGAAVDLPITDESVYPTMFGSEVAGHSLYLQVGLPGTNRLLALARSERREVTSATTSLTFEWITAPVVLRVEDQAGREIPASSLTLDRARGAISFSTGARVSLPITDESIYPTMFGEEARGYRFVVSPGVECSGRPPASASNLYRIEYREVGSGTACIVVEWNVIECEIALRRTGGAEVPGSSLFFGYPLYFEAAGSVVRLPITENAAYPTLGGAGADGFSITINPGDSLSANGTFLFEVLKSGSFEPTTFDVGGTWYSLFCRSNNPPIVAAGPNLTIVTSQRGATVIGGTAWDVDNQTLVYHWMEGETVLFGPAPVGVGGEAPLDLRSIAALPIGEHVLTLSVTDGIDTSTARMTLTVGNSPATCAASGSGTYQDGLDAVVLGGTVADYDGDLLQWSWWLGSTEIAQGVLQAAAAGGPSALPTVTIGTGAMGQLDVGTYDFELRVTDGVSTTAFAHAKVMVIDSAAPRIAPVADTSVLWPPNHQMVPVAIRCNAVDASGGPVLLQVAVRSSGDAQKNGSGNTIPDFSDPLVDQGTGTIYLLLRAERAGNGPGRIYTITVTATDSSLNQSSAEVQVVAPHDRGD